MLLFGLKNSAYFHDSLLPVGFIAQSSATTVLQSSHGFAPRLSPIVLDYVFTITVRACLNAVTSVKISKVTLTDFVGFIF